MRIAPLVATAQKIVVFDVDEDWSYPGCQGDETNESAALEDTIAFYEPYEPPEYTEAEILGEWPSRDDDCDAGRNDE